MADKKPPPSTTAAPPNPSNINNSNTSNSKKTSGGNYRNRSLCSLLHYFVGIQLSVETKTGRIYLGQLENADEYMNVTLDEATLFWPGSAGGDGGGRGRPDNRQPQQEHAENNKDETPQELSKLSATNSNNIFTSVHIRGPTIRYFHFPDDLDLQAIIRVGMDRERAAAQKYKRGKRK